MDGTKALQNLLNGTASEEEISLLKLGLVNRQVSIGGNVNQAVIILGDGNMVNLTPQALDRLGGGSLLGDLNRDLTGDEIAAGLNRLEAELQLRAPILLTQFQEQTRLLRPTLKTNSNSLSESLRKEWIESLAHVNSLCMEALDISFNAVATGETLPEYEARCPFRGLESFRVEDHEFFFGREELTQKLVGRIQAHSFLAVLGASGSGKSSLVMAGMIPALDLDYTIIRPGTNPLEALESARDKPLLVADQFEELFTLTRDEKTRADFISELLDFAKSGKVIITMRSDFLGEAGAYRSLSAEIQNHIEIIPPMSADELHCAMKGQARWARLEFEADLSQQILDDVAGEPGAMPLLQHALWELWNRRHGRHLRAEEYRAFGGVKQAITSTAEKAYGECSKPEQEQVRDIFLRLTRLDEGDEGRDTRRRVLLGDLIPSGADAASIATLLDKLANARLIVKTVKDNVTEIEVAHEALIRHWERLRTWLNEDRDHLRLRDSVSDAAKEWEKSGKHETLLNSRWIKLDEALLLGQDSYYRLTDIEQAYLNECIFLRNKEQRERERRQRYTVFASVAAAVIFFILGSFGLFKSNEATSQAATAQANANVAMTAKAEANTQKKEAQNLAQLALARQLAVQSEKVIESNMNLGILLAVQSNKLADIPETRFALSNAIEYEPTIDKIIHLDNINPGDIVDHKMLLSSNEKKLVITVNYSNEKTSDFGCSKSEIIVINSEDGKIISSNKFDYFVSIQAIDSAGETAGLIIKKCKQNERSIEVWDINSNKILQSIPYFAYDLFFLSDGNTLLAAGKDKKITFWDIHSGKIIKIFEGHTASVYTLQLDQDEKILVSGSYNGELLVWDINTGQLIGGPILIREKSDVSYDAINSIVISGNHRYIIATAIDQVGYRIGRLIVWDLQTNKMVFTREAGAVLIDLHRNDIIGSYEVPSNTIKLWNIENGETTKEIKGYSSTLSLNGDAIIASKDGNTIYGIETNNIVFWNLEKKSQLGFPIFKNNEIPSIAVDHSGKLLAIDGKGVITLVNLETGMTHKAIQSNLAYLANNFLVFHPVLPILAGLGTDSTLNFWDSKSALPVSFIENNNHIYSFAFSTDGKMLVIVKDDQLTVNVIDLTTKDVTEFQLEEKADEYYHIAFASNNQKIVMGGLSKNIYIWDIQNGYLQALPVSTYNIPSYLKVNPDNSNEVAVAKLDNHRIDVYNIESLTIVKSFIMPYSEFVTQPIFSPDGKKIIVAVCPSTPQSGDCVDAYAYIFDVASTKLETKLPLRAFNSVFSLDEKTIFAVSNNNIVYGWSYDIDLWRKLGCYLSGRNFTVEEWNTYLGELAYDKTCTDVDLHNDEYKKELPPILDKASSSFIKDKPSAGQWAASSILPPGLSEAFPVILQCRESADSDKKTNEFLGLWAITVSNPQVWISDITGNILVKNEIGDIVDSYDIKNFLGGPSDWIMSIDNFYQYTMQNPYEGDTSLELNLTNITAKQLYPQSGDYNFTVSITSHISSGNTNYPKHNINMRIKNNNDNLKMKNVLIVGFIIDSNGNAIDILTQVDTKNVPARQETDFSLNSLSKTGRCTGPAKFESNFIFHYWISYFREDNQLITKYFTEPIEFDHNSEP